MNNWHSFLHQQGAAFPEQNSLSFNEKPGDYPKLLEQNTITPLIHLGALSLNGIDAVRFLQGQVTCNVEQLSAEHSLLGARCNPKGRALTSFRLVQVSDDHLLMIMDRSLIQSSIDDLSKFAAFFKVQLSDASEEFQCIGLTGQHSTLDTSTLDTSTLAAKNIITCQISDGRQLLVIQEDQAETFWLSLAEQSTPVGTEFWILQDVKAGIANIQLETSAMFIPQMLNFQAIDGISFKKGCYTGQEVVARMKYLGKVKRRMYRIAVTGNRLPSPGVSCQLPNKEQSIGNVVTATNANEGLQEMLVVLTEEAAQSEALIIGTEHHKKVDQLSLPYEI